MKARMYALKAGARMKSKPSGQALRVVAELRRVREPRLATDIDDAIASSTGTPGSVDGPHVTRQKSLRVTLYYLLVFKKAGIVVASEQPDTEGEVLVDVEDGIAAASLVDEQTASE